MFASMPLVLKIKLALGLCAMALLLPDWISDPFGRFMIAITAYLIVAWPVLKRAARDLFIRRRMSEQFLMSIATFGAFFLQDYPEALAVMIFYLIGDAFENYAANRSHGEIEALVKLKPTQVRVINADGSESIVRPRKVKLGSTIRVLAGESIALDGTLVQESAAIDLSALNGESEPALFTQGQEIPSGGINMGKVIELVVTKDSKNSSITRLINLIEDAAVNKSRPEALITRFSVYYTPFVVGCAVLMALVPLFVSDASFHDWLTRALVFLVVSCPCALVLSVPLSFFGGLGALSHCGLMVKGSIHIESVAKLKAMAFDKTGTLTKGQFNIIALELVEEQAAGARLVATKLPKLEQAADDLSANALFSEAQQNLLRSVYALERLTTHPIGMAIVRYLDSFGLVKDCEQKEVSEVHELVGFGIQGKVNGIEYQLGKRQLVERFAPQELPILESASSYVGTELYVLANGKLLGRIILADEIKEQTSELFAALKRHNIRSFMLTGDKQAVANDIAKRCGIDEVYAEQLPENKIENFKRIKAQEGTVAYVGDGINDAPTLALSDVGISMGQFGSAAAVEAADVVVMNDKLEKLPILIELCKRIYALAKQNMILVLSVKAAILLLGALGIANIWLAILGDVGLCVIAVLNAMRSLSWGKEYSS